MEIALHLGAHRTASTTFQAYVNRNRITLRKGGLACWTPQQTRDGRLDGMFQRPDRLRPLFSRAADRSIGRLKLQQERLARDGAKTLLMSEENLLGTMGNNLSRWSLYGDLKARLLRLKPSFAVPLSGIALTIRSYDSYWSSVLSHQVMRGRAAPDPNGLDLLVTQPRRWRHVIQDITEVFPGVPLLVFCFEDVASRPEVLLSQLVPALPIIPKPPPNARSNVGPTIATLRDFVRRRQDDSAIPLGKANGKWHPFSNLQSEALKGQYSEDLSWLRTGADGLARQANGEVRMGFGTGPWQRPGQAPQGRQGTHGQERAARGAVA